MRCGVLAGSWSNWDPGIAGAKSRKKKSRSQDEKPEWWQNTRSEASVSSSNTWKHVDYRCQWQNYREDRFHFHFAVCRKLNYFTALTSLTLVVYRLLSLFSHWHQLEYLIYKKRVDVTRWVLTIRSFGSVGVWHYLQKSAIRNFPRCMLITEGGETPWYFEHLIIPDKNSCCY